VAGRGPEGWDERYRERGPEPGPPEQALVAALSPLRPGRAVDLGCGTGRHTLWLATRGWCVTAVDFSAVGVERGRAAAERRGLSVDWVVADVRHWGPPSPLPVDLVLAARIRLPVPVLQAASGWLGPGGRLVVLGHAVEPGREPLDGPRDPALRHTEESLRAAAAGLAVERLDRVERPTPAGLAVDLLLVAQRAAPVASRA
jgi:SAM-dependent methyltransferase